jgi:ankyrin repeat protein
MRGQTPLHNAAAKGWKEASICLLDHGADVNVKDKQGFSPLMYLAEEGSHLLVEFLIQVNRIE